MFWDKRSCGQFWLHKYVYKTILGYIPRIFFKLLFWILLTFILNSSLSSLLISAILQNTIIVDDCRKLYASKYYQFHKIFRNELIIHEPVKNYYSLLLNQFLNIPYKFSLEHLWCVALIICRNRTVIYISSWNLSISGTVQSKYVIKTYFLLTMTLLYDYCMTTRIISRACTFVQV